MPDADENTAQPRGRGNDDKAGRASPMLKSAGTLTHVLFLICVLLITFGAIIPAQSPRVDAWITFGGILPPELRLSVSATQELGTAMIAIGALGIVVLCARIFRKR